MWIIVFSIIIFFIYLYEKSTEIKKSVENKKSEDRLCENRIDAAADIARIEAKYGIFKSLPIESISELESIKREAAESTALSIARVNAAYAAKTSALATAKSLAESQEIKRKAAESVALSIARANAAEAEALALATANSVAESQAAQREADLAIADAMAKADATTVTKQLTKEQKSDSNLPNDTTDAILDSIDKNYINRSNISFGIIRQVAGRDHGVRDELGRGRSILSTHEQLDQYLYSYGPMIRSQWENLLQNINIPEGDIEIVDYACGQGLASLLFLDTFKNFNISKKISKINLIEPSSVALIRACGILACYCPDSTIITINKFLDDLNKSDLKISESSTKLHFFPTF